MSADPSPGPAAGGGSVAVHRILTIGEPGPAPRREAALGGRSIRLLGEAPRAGGRLAGRFSLPAARRAEGPLSGEALSRGLWIVSTLPNIERHACLEQVAEIEARASALFPAPRVAHVSADAAIHWGEVDEFHPGVRAPGYTLCGASDESRRAFLAAFGVGVLGERRIAHGLFGLRDGVFLAAEIPFDQMQTPEVGRFLEELGRALAGRGRGRDPEEG